MIAVTFALPAESADFVKRLRDRARKGGIVHGSIGDRRIAVLHTGVGKTTCRRRMAELLQDRQFDLLISAGFAGALRDDMAVGDLLLAENFSTLDLKRVRGTLAHPNLHLGRLATLDHIIASAVERNEVARETGAIAVDMETEFIARACAEYGLPLLCLRAISDTPARSLPAPAHVLFDLERQKTKLSRLAGYLIKHPATMLRLASFARQIRSARRGLATALEDLLKSDGIN